MITVKTQLQTKVNDKDHTYQCDPSCSLQDVLDALNEFRSYVFGRIKEHEENQDKNMVEAPKE